MFWTAPSLRNDPTYQTPAHDAKTAELNGLITGLANYNPAVSVVDVFSKLNGHAFDVADFQSSNLHPSALGSTKMGEWMGEALLAAINNEGRTGIVTGKQEH